jgi:dienelactone hydrolase
MERILLTLSIAALCLLPVRGHAAKTSKAVKVGSGDGKFVYEVFGGESAGAVLILLHGASGPDSAFYRQQGEYFAGKGFTVWLPHYFDATHGTNPTDEHYESWVNVVRELVAECQKSSALSQKKIVLLGYSLGASVALAAGSEGVEVSAIAEWYGSLPDEFFYRMQGMPPVLILHGGRDSNIPVANAEQLIKLCGMRQLTCESHIYPEQEHGFSGEAMGDADERTVKFFSRYLQDHPEIAR